MAVTLINSSSYGYLHKSKLVKIPAWQDKRHKSPPLAKECVWRSEDNLKKLACGRCLTARKRKNRKQLDDQCPRCLPFHHNSLAVPSLPLPSHFPSSLVIAILKPSSFNSNQDDILLYTRGKTKKSPKYIKALTLQCVGFSSLKRNLLEG